MEKLTLSELPDQILCRILYFLPVEEAFRTCCILSKRWKKICDTLLDFSKIFNTPGDSPNVEVLNFVTKYLLMRQANEKIGIDSFKLNLPNCDSQLTSYINTWFETLSRCNIREIFFSISFFNRFRRYSFPPEIFSSESLIKLELKGCKFELSKYCIDIKLVSLKCLSLTHMVVSEELVERLLESCASLENLTLEQCQGFSSVKVEGLLSLRELSLISNRNLKRVIINEPSLRCLYYRGGYIKHDDIEFSNCINLNKLSLSHASITGEQLKKQLSALKNLKELEVFSCGEIPILYVSNASLVSLYIEHNEELSAAYIITPNLQHLYIGSLYTSTMVSVFLEAPPTLKVDFYFVPRVLFATMFVELLEFLNTFDGARLRLATSIPNSTIPQGWSKQFSQIESLTGFQLDPEAGLLDVLRKICPVVRKKRSVVKISTD